MFECEFKGISVRTRGASGRERWVFEVSDPRFSRKQLEGEDYPTRDMARTSGVMNRPNA